MKRLALALVPALLLLACSDDDAAPPDAAPDAVPPDAAPPDAVAPSAEFARFCTSGGWDTTLVPGKLGEVLGAYGGYYPGMELGTLETMKIIPDAPYQVTRIRVRFGTGVGTARVRLMRTLGRSYPLGYGALDADPTANLIPPIDVEVTTANRANWIELDVAAAGAFLLPSEHYVLVYEHLAATSPALAVADLQAGESSRGLLLVPSESVPYGIDGQYMMELDGNRFCPWTEPERLFGEASGTPFASIASQRAAVTDVDGDGHDDLLLNAGGPQLFLGDGAGGFTAAPGTPFTAAPKATMVLIGDVNNDGHRDAIAVHYVNANGDGDAYTVAQGDCNDSQATVFPGATETGANATDGLDNDCDGVADDGTATTDADGDGQTIAGGDCDDRFVIATPTVSAYSGASTYTGALEIIDGRDNDCDGVADEDFPTRVLLGDGTGSFALDSTFPLDHRGPTAAAALGDADLDGDLDLYMGYWLVHYPDNPSVPDRFYGNDGAGVFTDATSASGLTAPAAPCYGVLFTDSNNDGWPDIWVGNYGYESNYLYIGDGDGTFTERGSALGVARDSVGAYGGNTFGGDFGDIDNDGDIDLYAANIAHPRYQPWSDPSVMLINQGAPTYNFINERAARGLAYDEGDVNAAFGDFDNDGDLDLAVGSLYQGHYSRVYRNDGPVFTDVTYETNTAVDDSVSVVWSDVNEDGDLDLFITDRTVAPYVHLFINRLPAGSSWLELDLQGNGTTVNRDAVGARVTIVAGGVSRIRDVRGGGGHSNTQQPHRLHFGLGAATTLTSLTVAWPGGVSETFTGAAPGGIYRLVQGAGAAVVVP